MGLVVAVGTSGGLEADFDEALPVISSSPSFLFAALLYVMAISQYSFAL